MKLILIALLITTQSWASTFPIPVPSDNGIYYLYHAIDRLPEDTEYARLYKQYQKDQFSTDYKVGWEQFAKLRGL